MSTPPAWDLPRPHVLAAAVRDEHIDLMRHVNNVVYLQWLESVAWDHSQALGLGPQEYRNLGHGMVVRQHQLRYEAAVRPGEELLLATWIVEADKVSLHRRFQFVRPRDGRTVFRAQTHYVCVDIVEGRLRRMPPAFVQAYSAACRRDGEPEGPGPAALPLV